jgi:starch phosphorylase
MKPAPSTELDGIAEFAGTENPLYERHLIFDNIVNPGTAGWRERFEAFARSVRDILSKNWLKTDQT